MKNQSKLDPNKVQLKVSCIFKEDGKEIEEIIEQSFRFFVKSELMKQCG